MFHYPSTDNFNALPGGNRRCIPAIGRGMKGAASLALVLCMCAILGCGRLVKVPEEERIIRRVYEVDIPKGEIYDRAIEWCAKKFSTAKDDIIVRDHEKGKIIVNGSGRYSEYFDFLVDRDFTFTMTIEIKDRRYRITFENFTVYYDERETKASRAAYKFEIDKIRKQMETLMSECFSAVAGGDRETKKGTKADEEW